MRPTRQLIATLLFGAVAGAANAQEAMFDSASAFETVRSRAEVRAETRAALMAGQIPRGEITPEPVFNRFSTRSRSEVHAATLSALAAGEIPHGEATPDFAQHFVSVKTRAQVRAETREAMRLDLIPHGEAPLRVATPAQREAIRLAGLRAREAEAVLAAK